MNKQVIIHQNSNKSSRFKASSGFLYILILSSLVLIFSSYLTIIYFFPNIIPNIPISWSRNSLIILIFSGFFASLVVISALRIVSLNGYKPLSLPTPLTTTDKEIDPALQGILLNEFEYARQTAGESMEERNAVINFYLLIVGGASSGVIAFLGNFANHIELIIGAVALLWIVTIVGWLTLFKLIALRIAWVGSAASMNAIKEFYIANSERMHLSGEVLQSAFVFKSSTIPSAGKHWNVAHYSALLVAFLDTAIYFGGIMLLVFVMPDSQTPVIVLIGILIAVLFLASHWWIYDLSLKPRN